jgi:hypothetical protein
LTVVNLAQTDVQISLTEVNGSLTVRVDVRLAPDPLWGRFVMAKKKKGKKGKKKK